MQRTDTFQYVLQCIIAGIPSPAGRAITGAPRVSRPCFTAVWHVTSVARTRGGGVSGARCAHGPVIAAAVLPEAAARRHLWSVITALQESAQPAGQPATGR